ncbi:type II toxin-antitoxin system RelE/ParE family toxin [Burkholderia sp. Bp8963]|uniref:type II toxin-antitoxin system RelE/ParE family toxin n=1 Tax=Burkholderia sp. Bp8963 TaxID=2184547 RepID=UPI000F596354|nr:type II toxin-antitoxin system RelE/ParE family toxin [Burkholderia sp. Bp8963]RQS59086.1 type II toxin-antitoxin system RelE/ParE family toxin [Burkholderia sp. Bp8963]
MTFRVQFAPTARDQLADLEDYIVEAGSPASAIHYVDAIVTYCTSLATFPKRGRMRDDLLSGLRITHYRGRTVIAFHVDDETQAISIVGIFYGGQDYESHLLTDTDD